jgi:uncharacterized protein YuzE
MDENSHKLTDIIEIERAEFKKRDQANKDIIVEISKKLKVTAISFSHSYKKIKPFKRS